MYEPPKLKVEVEFGEIRANFEGDVDEVFEAVLRFLTQICPNLEIVRKMVYTPDLARISDELSDLVELTTEGLMLISVKGLPTSKLICLALLGAYVGNKFGKLSKNALSSNDLARITGKMRKTVMNELPRLADKGYVERTPEGEYLITAIGIRQAEELIKEYKAGGRSG